VLHKQPLHLKLVRRCRTRRLRLRSFGHVCRLDK
jgi:hypothetical protein